MAHVLQVHNFYQQAGGEDAVFFAEGDLLAARGHHVARYVRRNDEISDYGLWANVALGARALWACDSYRDIQAVLKRHKPDVVHFHNTFPLISPAAYYACHACRVPVVQTLQNYRVFCPGATLLRDGRVCEDCLGRAVPWPGILHGCYRKSRAATAAAAAMLSIHNALKTWAKRVDLFIALTNFARQKLIEGGLPAEKIVVKPNFIYPDPGRRTGSGEYALFVGRLATEKGLRTLVAAWKRLGIPIPLRVIGDGPRRAETQALASGLPDISFEGHLSREAVTAALKNARFLVVPSEWYEGFPLVIVEAFACGVPVIASRLGSMEEIVEHGRTGLHFNPGDPDDLAEKVEWAWAHPAEMEVMGHNARAQYEACYSARQNYQRLMEIYKKAGEGGKH